MPANEYYLCEITFNFVGRKSVLGSCFEALFRHVTAQPLEPPETWPIILLLLRFEKICQNILQMTVGCNYCNIVGIISDSQGNQTSRRNILYLCSFDTSPSQLKSFGLSGDWCYCGSARETPDANMPVLTGRC